jgi:hypothetical protein
MVSHRFAVTLLAASVLSEGSKFNTVQWMDITGFRTFTRDRRERYPSYVFQSIRAVLPTWTPHRVIRIFLRPLRRRAPQSLYPAMGRQTMCFERFQNISREGPAAAKGKILKANLYESTKNAGALIVSDVFRALQELLSSNYSLWPNPETFWAGR